MRIMMLIDMKEETYDPHLIIMSIVAMVSGASMLSWLWASGYKFEDLSFTIIATGMLFFFGFELVLLECYIYYKNKKVVKK